MGNFKKKHNYQLKLDFGLREIFNQLINSNLIEKPSQFQNVEASFFLENLQNHFFSLSCSFLEARVIFR